MKFELNRNNIILITIFLLLVVVFSYLYNQRYPQNKKTELPNITALNDYNRFFAISNSANTYINFIAKEDASSLAILLDEKYQKENSINEENILNNLEKLDGGSYTFQARKIYQENLTKNIVKYYVHGDLKELMPEYAKPTDYYLIVFMDTNNRTFSVMPYNGKIFKEE